MKPASGPWRWPSAAWASPRGRTTGFSKSRAQWPTWTNPKPCPPSTSPKRCNTGASIATIGIDGSHFRPPYTGVDEQAHLRKNAVRLERPSQRERAVLRTKRNYAMGPERVLSLGRDQCRQRNHARYVLHLRRPAFAFGSAGSGNRLRRGPHDAHAVEDLRPRHGRGYQRRDDPAGPAEYRRSRQRRPGARRWMY